MQDDRPTLVAQESSKHTPLLIIDKKGRLGNELAKKLQEQFLVVLVSEEEDARHNNVIHIPFKRKIPIIPDNYYSHMFLFYNGEEEILDMLPSVNKKAIQTNARLLFITSLPFLSPELFRRLEHQTYQNVQVVIFGEVFSSEATEMNVVSMFLRQAKMHQRVVLPNDGLEKLYPIAIDDVFAAIIGTAFATEQERKTILVYPEHPVSGLSLARILQKYHPLLKIDFGKYKGRYPTYHLPTSGMYYFHEYPLEKKMKEVLGELPEKAMEFTLPRKVSTRYPRKAQVFHPTVLWILLLGVVIVPIVTVVLSAIVGIGALYLSVREVSGGNMNNAKLFASTAERSFFVSEIASETIFYLDVVAPSQKSYLLSQIKTGKELAATEGDVLRGISLIQSVWQKQSQHPKDDFFEGIATVKKSLITLQRMRAEDKLPKEISTAFVRYESLVTPLQNVLDVVPSLVGFDGKKKYLVLLQNNMELRPGGGFIGSYGLLTLDQGAIADFQVYDVYEADGKLTFHVEPPYGLRRYLGSSHWFLRDSNFAVDFPQNASQAMTFLEYEVGEKVDGVIAIDTTFFKNLLAAFGSVTVPEYKETITPNNFYLRTQTHAEKDFFPGSTQKKDFLQALLAAMKQRLVSNTDISYTHLMTSIGESVNGKHVLVALRDEELQKLLTVNNLSSSLWDGREDGDNTFLDTFGVIDANVGVNKVNYYLKRTIEQKTVIDTKGTIQTTAMVTYANTSKKDSPFGGDYKNYVRFVIPAEAVVRGIAIDGVRQEIVPAVTDPEIFTSPTFEKPEGFEVETSSEQGKTLIGFLVFVPKGAMKKVTLSYEVVGAVSMQEPAFGYTSWLFKEPGTLDDDYSYSLTYPSSYKLVAPDLQLSDVGGKLIYSNILSGDKHFTVEFSKK